MKKETSVSNSQQRKLTEKFDLSLLKTFQLNSNPGAFKIAIVQSRFNTNICEELSNTCINQLTSQGMLPENIYFTTVAGALEIPIILKLLAQRQKFNAMIAIGTIIRGETYHFEIVANESSRCISNLALELATPIVNAILTTENEEQAHARIIEKAKDAADIAIEMAGLIKSINSNLG